MWVAEVDMGVVSSSPPSLPETGFPTELGDHSSVRVPVP